MKIDYVKYLNDTVFCKIGTSPIHGVGVFAIRNISEGQLLTDYNGEPIINLSELEFHCLLPEIQELILQKTLFEEDLPIRFINPNRTQVLQAFMNHSIFPNSDGHKALMTINKGDEVTENFNEIVNNPHRLTIKHRKTYETTRA